MKKSWPYLFPVFWLGLCLLLLLHRWNVLHEFGFQYPDSDQAIMWQGAVDFAQGIFHEPRFYGQDYNTMIESLFAVPPAMVWNACL